MATAGYGSVLALTLVLLLAACGLVMCVVLLAVQPEPIPRLGIGQRQSAETALYLVSFGLLLPAALLSCPRLADAVARGPNGASLSALTALLAAGRERAEILLNREGGSADDGQYASPPDRVYWIAFCDGESRIELLSGEGHALADRST